MKLFRDVKYKVLLARNYEVLDFTAFTDMNRVVRDVYRGWEKT